MQNKFLALCTVAALIAQPGLAHAQLGNGGTTYSDVNNKNQWQQFLGKFVGATGDANAAQARLMYSVGMSDQAIALAAQTKDLNSTATPGMVEQVMASRDRVAAALIAKLAGGGMTLDPAAKQQFGEGIDALAAAIKQYEELGTDLPYMKTQLRGAGEKARTGLFVAKSLPDYLREAKKELDAATVFARANNITFGAPAIVPAKP